MELSKDFRQSALGVIPSKWEVAQLGQICVKIQDGTHFSPTLGGNDYLYVTSKNIRPGRLDLSTAERISADEHRKIYGRCDTRRGDILLTKDGANTGNAALNTLDEEVSLLSSVAFLRFNDLSHDPRFFLQQLLADSGQARMREMMSGNAITRLTLEKIRAFEVVVPPLDEQQAIADALSDADALVESLDALIAKKRDMKQAAMQQLLTGRTRLPGFTDEWHEVHLGALLNYEQPTRYLVRNAEYEDAGTTPVLTAGKSFILGYTYETEGVYDKGPTILFDDFTTATQWVDFPFKVKSSACKMLTSRDPDASLRFVHELMRTIPYVPTDHMRHWIGIASEWPVVVPPSDEQQAIAEVLSDMDAEIDALVAQHEKAELVKQGMMQELLSGRVRLA